LNSGIEGQQPLTEIGEKVERRKKGCEERRNREEELRNRSRDKTCHDL